MDLTKALTEEKKNWVRQLAEAGAKKAGWEGNPQEAKNS